MIKAKKAIAIKILFFVLVAVSVAIASYYCITLNKNDSAQAYLYDWDPGYIISDNVMTDKNSMSEADIQNFLKSKNPKRPYYGTGTSERILSMTLSLVMFSASAS